MPASITITDIPPYDGNYPLNLDEEFFTNQELREIKLSTGLRGGELMEAITAGDNDLVVAFAVIALKRAGVAVVPAVLWEATAGGILFDAGSDEEAAGEEGDGPPTVELGPPEIPGSSGVTSGSPTVPSPVTQLRTGIQESDIGAVSVSGT